MGKQTSKSIKLVSDSVPRRHRLKRTLRRKPGYRPIDVEDVKWFWAAYRKGDDFHRPDVFEEGLSATEFKDVFIAFVTEHFPTAFMLTAPTDKGVMPVGAIFGLPVAQMFMTFGGVFFPWATPRNRVETIINAVNELRKEVVICEFAKPETKDFWMHVVRHGIMRRAGTSQHIHGESAPIFESISPEVGHG